MPTFDKTKHQQSMAKAVNKLVADLKKEGVEFLANDPNPILDNVIFASKGKHIAMSHHSFYRYSGIGWITRDKKGSANESEVIELPIDSYLQTFIKPIILRRLEVASN